MPSGIQYIKLKKKKKKAQYYCFGLQICCVLAERGMQETSSPCGVRERMTGPAGPGQGSSPQLGPVGRLRQLFPEVTG